jgi:hypothetical protein
MAQVPKMRESSARLAWDLECESSSHQSVVDGVVDGSGVRQKREIGQKFAIDAPLTLPRTG